jgi:hypothetical protein
MAMVLRNSAKIVVKGLNRNSAGMEFYLPGLNGDSAVSGWGKNHLVLSPTPVRTLISVGGGDQARQAIAWLGAALICIKLSPFKAKC